MEEDKEATSSTPSLLSPSPASKIKSRRRQSGRGGDASKGARPTNNDVADGTSLSVASPRNTLFKVIDVDDGESVDSEL